MNRYQIFALFFMTATGCSAPRPSAVEAGSESAQQKPLSLSRLQPVAQLQVDAASVYGQMITYYFKDTGKDVASEEPLTTHNFSHRLDALLSFRPGSTELLPAYANNRVELDRIADKLETLAADANGSWQSIRITGYASPDGSTPRNEELAATRAQRFSNYLSTKLAIPREKITIGPGAEDWEGLKQIAEAADKPYAAQLAAIIDGTPDPDARRKALKALDKGSVWRDMEQTLFSRLRRMELEVVFDTVVPAVDTATANEAAAASENDADMARLLALFNNRPEALTLNELLTIAPAYRPGTEQFREVYEQAAYRFPDCMEAQLNAGAAALAAADTEAARFFLERVKDHPEAWINMGVLSLMEEHPDEAATWFKKALPHYPREARRNLDLVSVTFGLSHK